MDLTIFNQDLELIIVQTQHWGKSPVTFLQYEIKDWLLEIYLLDQTGDMGPLNNPTFLVKEMQNNQKRAQRQQM